MKYSFICYGHENITSMHKTTLEFTKDPDLTLNGDCIIGVKSDYSLKKIKKFIKKSNNKKITIKIETINNKDTTIEKNNTINKINNNIEEKGIKKDDYGNKIIEKINAEINPNFNSDKEMVIRKSDFIDTRTFAIKADKAAFELNKDLIGFLKEKGNEVRIGIINR
jgi:uncharacterized protein